MSSGSAALTQPLPRRAPARGADRARETCDAQAMDPRPEPDDRELARRKLIGRVVIVVLGLLLAAYLVPVFLR